MINAEPAYSVVHALRNVALHYSLPHIQVQFQVGGPAGGVINDPSTTAKLTFLLDVQNALELVRASGGRKSPTQRKAVEVLADWDDDIALTELLERFLVATLPVQRWLREAEMRAEGSTVDDFVSKYNDVTEEYNQALGAP